MLKSFSVFHGRNYKDNGMKLDRVSLCFVIILSCITFFFIKVIYEVLINKQNSCRVYVAIKTSDFRIIAF